MTEQPANIAREAKGIHQSLKELLKEKEPFDKEVDFQRKNLRRRYLSLLFTHPHARESKDVETHLWMQTSYAFISSYKQRIHNIERLMDRKLKTLDDIAHPPDRKNNTHVVEHRKLVQRFRQFLAEEEKFWNQIVIRLRRSFSLDEATPVLVALGVVNEADESLSLDSTEGIDFDEHVSRHGRNHFQFPPEDPSTVFVASSKSEKEAWLGVMAKALICLGDINRYREFHIDAGVRNQDDGRRRRVRTRRGISVETNQRPGSYEKAQHCYEQARLLVPSDGNPSHQLAILATYQKDTFMSLVHYYRAICVKTPYDTALQNLNSALSKALEHWKKEKGQQTDDTRPQSHVESFQEKIIVLHALWKVGIERGEMKMESLSRRHHKRVSEEFLACVSGRHLPIDLIASTIVLSQSALWKHRMIRTSTITGNSKPNKSPPPENTSVLLEWHILRHLLDLHRALLEVGINELRVPPSKDVADSDLAQHITATFRRTLPALRIASKWMRVNVKYLLQDHEFNAYQSNKRVEGVEVSRIDEHAISRTSVSTRRFWRCYADFMTALSSKFPISKLPSLTAPLEEDIEMRGFLPLRNMMDIAEMTHVQGRTSPAGPEDAQEVHPNEWQLMRIADLLHDGNSLATTQDIPVTSSQGVYKFRDDNAELSSPCHTNRDFLPPVANATTSHSNAPERHANLTTEDGMMEESSRTDEDILREAFNVVRESAEEDEDEIVWDPRGPVSPVAASVLPSSPSHTTTAPVAPAISLLNSPARASSLKMPSPFPSHCELTQNTPTTAQDLLNDVMSGRATRTRLESSAPAPALLFGKELSYQPGHNIWSASKEEQSLKFSSQPNQTYQQRQAQASSGLDASSAFWTNKPSGETSQSRHDAAGSMTSVPYANRLPPIGVAACTHQRATSSSVTLERGYRLHQTHDLFSGQQDMPMLLQQPSIAVNHMRGNEGHGGHSTTPTVQNVGTLNLNRPVYQHQPSRSYSHSYQHPLNSLQDPVYLPRG